MKTQEIKAVQIGHRQLTFGFDDHLQDMQNHVVVCIKKMSETHGQIYINHFVEYAYKKYEWAQKDILQSIFWAANELEIHLRSAGKTITTFEAKEYLLQSFENSVEIVTNKDVKQSVFQETMLFCRAIFNGNKQEYKDDQYQFSLSLLSHFNKWNEKLKSYEGIAQKPFYPGKNEINCHLQSLEMLLGKKDSYSLISNCCLHQEVILKIAEDIKTLSVFYIKHISFWDQLVQSMEQFQDNLDKIKKRAGIFYKYKQLMLILQSPYPYDQILAAKQLLPEVQTLNNQIVKKNTNNLRKDALSKIDSMMKTLSKLLDKINADQDHRNQLLYTLQAEKKQMQHAGNIQQINQIFTRIKDIYYDFVDELEE